MTDTYKAALPLEASTWAQWSAPQVVALVELYERDPDGAATMSEFLHRAKLTHFAGQPEYALVNWCGMVICIERDGYRHT